MEPTLPPYASSESDLKDVDIAKVEGAMQSYMQSPEAMKTLEEEIEAIMDSALSIEISFRNVKDGLFKAEKAATPYHEEITPLRKEWSDYHKEYVHLLWKSREVAGHARAAADDFAGDFLDFLDDPDATVEEKKDELKSYKKQLEEDKVKAQGLSQDFSDLKNHVVGFQEKVTELINSYNLADMQAEIVTLQKEVEDIGHRITELKLQMIYGGLATVGLGGLAGASAALGCLCPLLWIGTLLAGLYTVRAGTKLYRQLQEQKALKKQSEDKADRLLKMTEALEGMQLIKGILEPLQSDMTNISTKLGAFAGVWATIQAEIGAIENKMIIANTSQSKKIFSMRLKTIKSTYKVLSIALYKYEKTVDKKEIFSAHGM